VQRDGSVPLPSQLDQFVKDREAAIQLGKALFWDMQVGSDGVQSCASCHFHAGADNRTRNQFNPDRLTVVDVSEGDVRGYSRAPLIPDLRFDTRQPNETLVREDFPLIKSIQSFVRNPNGTILPSAGNSNDVISSHGTFFTFFNGVRPGSITDAGMLLPDPVWNVGGVNVRRVEPRNAPTVINAVFNFTNFWDGRAHPRFNGFDSFGDQNPSTSVLANETGGLVDQRISLDNASLASQAMTPALSFVEMSFGSPAQRNSRDLVEIGIKLLRRSDAGVRLMPLGLQRVDPLRQVVVGHDPVLVLRRDQVARALADEDHARRLAAAELPDPLRQIIGRGMQPGPADRFSSIDELARALITAQAELGWAPTRYIGAASTPSPSSRPRSPRAREW
jgi:hypothetical protein